MLLKSEMYKAKSGTKNGIESIKKLIAPAQKIEKHRIGFEAEGIEEMG